MAHTTEDCIERIKRDGMVPISQNTFEENDLIGILNDKLKLKVVPQILSVRQEFFRTSKVIPLVTSVDRYPVPERAIGNSIKAVYYLADTSKPYERVPLGKMDIENWSGDASFSGQPTYYDMEGDEIVIPRPTSVTGGLLVYYFQRPSELVATTECAKITGISSVGGTTTFTVNTDLTGSLAVGDKVDFLSANSPFLLWSQDVVITAITASTIAVATTGVSNDASVVEPVVNDYICPAKKANIPMIPEEFIPQLCELAIAQCHKALGAQANRQMAKEEAAESAANGFKLIENRVESSPDVAYDRFGVINSLFGA